MATSGSFDFTQTRNEIIKDALILVNGIEDDETPSSFQTDYANRMLNRMIKSWMKEGLKLWVTKQGELDLGKGQSSYTLGSTGDYTINRPLMCENFRRKVDGVETPVRKVGRQTYMRQTNKSSEGKPVMAYYDPQLTNGVLYLWPTPDSGKDQLIFDYREPLEDFDNGTDNPDFPVEWLDAIVYNLAVRLIPMYEVRGDDRAFIVSMAQSLKDSVMDEDDNDDSFFLVPDMSRSSM
jgi:hypothetical protein